MLGSTAAGACSSSHGAAPGAAGAGGAENAGAIACERNSDCPGALLCDRVAHGCVECLKSADCEDGQGCLAGSCHTECRSDKDCRATDQLCGDANVCVDCLTDAHCARGEVCTAAGTCDEPSASGEAGAPSTGGSTNTGGAPNADAGAGNTLAGGTPSQGDVGMPGITEGGAGNIGPGCSSTPIDPCVGLPHFTGSQTVDGDPSDFCDIPPFTLALATSAYYRAPKAPITSTTQAIFRVGWSAAALHVFVEVIDATVHPNVSGVLANVWNGDNVEFYASPLTPAGLFNGARSYESGAFEVIADPPSPGGVATIPAGQAAYVSTGTAYAVPAAQYKSSLTANGYSIEAQIPWTAAAPEAGMPMGFDAGLSDDLDGLTTLGSDGISEYRDYYALLYNAAYTGISTYCSSHYEPYCDSRNWCVPTALP